MPEKVWGLDGAKCLYWVFCVLGGGEMLRCLEMTVYRRH